MKPAQTDPCPMASAREDAFLQGRPATGPGHYLRDVVLGANDGVVTTMAIIAASAGAALSPRIALILGVANLVADGFSMGAGNYLSLKSELQQRSVDLALEKPKLHGVATFLAFALVGAIPLLAYAIPGASSSARFLGAVVLAVIALALIGVWRAPFVNEPRWRSALDVLLIGGVATGAAFAIGRLAEWALLL